MGSFSQKKKHFLRTLGKRTTKETSEVFCVESSVVWCRDLDTTTEWAKTTRSIWDVGMEKDGACKLDRQNKTCSCARKSREGRIILELIRKRKLNWLGHWLRRNCLLKDALDHGFANHDTEGKLIKSPMHCCDVTKPPYLFSSELCTSPCTVNFCLCTPCAVGAPVSASLCSEYVKSDVILT